MLIPPGRAGKSRTDTTIGVTAFGVGVAVGGLAIGTLLLALGALLGWIPLAVRAAVFVALVAALVGVEFGVLDADLPQRRRMIPETRFRQTTAGGFFFFGVELGFGVRTYIPHVGPYVLAAAVLLVVPELTMVAAMAVGWGVGRTVPLLIRTVRSRAASRPVDSAERMDLGSDAVVAHAVAPAAVTVAAVLAAAVTGLYLVGL